VPEQVDIIIPTFNQSAFTVKCLESIDDNTSDYRVIWVDNGSDPDEYELVRDTLEDRDMPYWGIRNPVNLGFIKATNQGIASAQGDVVLLNNDTVVPPGWLEELREGVAQGFSIVGPLAQPGVESWQAVDNVSEKYSLVLPAPGFMRVKGMVAFFCTYITRQAIVDVGYLAEVYGIGFGDDDEFCLRAQQHGHKIGITTNVIVFHHHRTTFKAAFPDEWEDNKKANIETLKRRTGL
jgi:GT2 family glycosyltransferase